MNVSCLWEHFFILLNFYTLTAGEDPLAASAPTAAPPPDLDSASEPTVVIQCFNYARASPKPDGITNTAATSSLLAKSLLNSDSLIPAFIQSVPMFLSIILNFNFW